MKNIVLMTIFTLCSGLSAAQASTKTCSNSNQTLVYTSRKSDTAAAKEVATLKFQQFSQHNFSDTEPLIDFHLSGVEEKQELPAGSAIVKTTVGMANGSILGDGKVIPYSDWVICTEVINPVCTRCN
jgi:hypothetical protein